MELFGLWIAIVWFATTLIMCAIASDRGQSGFMVFIGCIVLSPIIVWGLLMLDRPTDEQINKYRAEAIKKARRSFVES